MSRYSAVAILKSYKVEYADDGTPIETPYDKDVYIDNYTVGLSTWAAARSNGLHVDASVRMRACDYEGEQTILIDGDEYEIERTQSSGEFVVLALRKRLRNAKGNANQRR